MLDDLIGGGACKEMKKLAKYRLRWRGAIKPWLSSKIHETEL